MFDRVEARYALRCVLFGLAAALFSLKASASGSDLTSGEALNALLDFGIGALGYAGIGAASKSVEPSIGRKVDGDA